MDLQGLHDSYQVYKPATNQVAKWLYINATACGHVVADVEHGAKPGRLKGKARKNARAKKSAEEDSYQVQVRDYVPMAQCIANSMQPRVEVPREVMLYLRGAIQQRKHHAEILKLQDPAKESTEDYQSHVYFIDVLEEVQSILSPLRAESSDLSEVEFNVKADTVKQLQNMFELLEVQETIDSETANKAVASGSKRADSTPVLFKTDLKPPKWSYKQVRRYIDVLGNWHMLRDAVRDNWKGYRDGKIDLVVASVTTNTAIDLIRSEQERFDADYNGNFDFLKPVCVLCAVEEVKQGRNPLDWGKSCHSSIAMFMSDYVQRSLVERNLCLPQPDLWDLYESHRHDCIAIQELNMVNSVVDEWNTLTFARENGAILEQHEILRGFEEMRIQKKLVFWVVCALLIYADIREILREGVTDAYDDFVCKAEKVSTATKQYLEFYEKGDFHDDDEASYLGMLNHNAQWIFLTTQEDRIERHRLELTPQHLQKTAKAIPKHYLLKRDPLWCGTILCAIECHHYNNGMFFANYSKSILVVAHLYNALQQRGLLKGQWTAMEDVISVQGANSLLLDPSRTTFERYFERASLATGYSQGENEKSRKHPKAAQKVWERLQKSASERLKNKTPVLSAFQKRSSDSSRAYRFGWNDVERIVEGVRDAPRYRGLEVETQETSMENTFMSLTQYLQADMDESRFSYMTLNMACWEIMRRINNQVLLEGNTEFVEDGEGVSLPHAVIAVLGTARDAEERGNSANNCPAVVKTVEIFNEICE